MRYCYLTFFIYDIEQQRVVGSLVYLKKARAYTAELFSKLKFSISATTLWSIVDKIFQKKINSLTEIKSDKKELHSIRGPLHAKRSTEDELSEYANIWTRSSLAMSKLSQSLNAKYLHFLQPNQYVKDSKPIMGEEKKFISAETYRNLVEVGYPILFKAGEFIKSQGVNYYDLTKTFKDINDPIYVDDCCHINKLGNDLLAIEVAKAIQAID